MDLTKDLSARQREILDLLRVHVRTHPYPPTVREIARALGLRSPSTVQNHLNTLEQRGLIRRDPSRSRTLEVVGEDESTAAAAARERSLCVPLLGRVAAGGPILAEQNIEDHLVLGPEIAGDGAFALTVHGDSMIEAGILDGDVVVVRPQRDAASGQIVVARIENPLTGEHEVTVKRFYREPGRIRLQPENAALEPILVRDVHLEGVVVAVVRVLR